MALVLVQQSSELLVCHLSPALEDNNGPAQMTVPCLVQCAPIHLHSCPHLDYSKVFVLIRQCPLPQMNPWVISSINATTAGNRALHTVGLNYRDSYVLVVVVAIGGTWPNPGTVARESLGIEAVEG